MSTPALRERPSTHVAGYLAAASIVVSVVGIVEKPVRTTTVAIVVALVATVMGGPHQRLAAVAVAVAAASFVVGMTVAVATGAELW